MHYLERWLFLPEQELEEKHRKSRAPQVFMYYNRIQLFWKNREDEARKVDRDPKNNDLMNYTWYISIWILFCELWEVGARF